MQRATLRPLAAAFGLALACAGISAPASAIDNPLVVPIAPVGANGVHGSVSFFQLGNDIVTNVALDQDRSGSQAVSIASGGCERPDTRDGWFIVQISGHSEETRIPGTRVDQLLNRAVLVHASADHASPVIGCAAIRRPALAFPARPCYTRTSWPSGRGRRSGSTNTRGASATPTAPRSRRRTPSSPIACSSSTAPRPKN